MQFVQLLLRNLHFLKASRTESRSASFSRRSSVIRDSRGFGLIEVIVVVAIISIVALGIATMMQDMFSQQQRAAQKGTLNSTRARLIEALQSPSSWAATVAHADNNASLVCLRAGNTCTHNTTVNFNVADASGAIIYPSATATAGFRPDGTNCNTFSTATPDPTCPFRWALSATLTCPSGSGTCPSPDIRILGPFTYSAGTASMGAGFNPNTYSIDFRRGSDVVLNQVVTFRYVENDASGEAGRCDTGAWVTRALNQTVDAHSIGASIQAGNLFRLPTGSYNCRVLVPGFKNGGNRIRIVRVVGMVVTQEAESGVALAAVNTGGSVVNSIEVVLRVNTASADFRVEHTCTSRPSASTWPSLNNDFSKGVPVPDAGGSYANTTFTTVTCIRTGA